MSETHKIPDGGPEFPGSVNDMSLRDWFAGLAMVGILADNTTDPTAVQLAEDAYEAADAMLAERNKKEQPQ